MSRRSKRDDGWSVDDEVGSSGNDAAEFRTPSERPRVLLLFSSSELGGAERSLTRMALVPSSVDYHLATLDGEGGWSAWARGMGAMPTVFGVRVSDEHGSFGWRALAALRQYVRAARIEVIYVCGARAAFALRLLKYVMRGVRVVHGVRWNPNSNSSLDVSVRLMERWGHRAIDGYITNSRIASVTLAERCRIPRSSIHVIYNGIAEMPSAVPPTAERPFEVLTVANLRPKKGHREYLSAIRMILHAVPAARFVFVGRDDMNGSVQRWVAEAGLDDVVRYAGFQADVSSFFRRARVFVLPSHAEGAPTAILESLAWGCPVVAYGIDGVPELIDHERDGFTVPLHDTSQLAADVIRLLTDSDLATRFGRAGREKVVTHHTLAAAAAEHARVLTRIARRSRMAAT